MAEAETRGMDIDYDSARELVYGMPYSDWKAKYQSEASAEQLQKFNDSSAE